MQGFFEKFLNRFLVFEKPKNKHFQGVWGAVPIHATLRSRFSAPLFARLPRGRKKFFLNILWLPVQPAARNPKMLLSPCFRQLLHPNCSCFPTVLATRLFLRPGCSCVPDPFPVLSQLSAMFHHSGTSVPEKSNNLYL